MAKCKKCSKTIDGATNFNGFCSNCKPQSRSATGATAGKHGSDTGSQDQHHTNLSSVQTRGGGGGRGGR